MKPAWISWLLVAQLVGSAWAQQQTPPGHHNVNTVNNTGTIIQINVATPDVAATLKSKAGNKKQWRNLLLPANEPTPINSCFASNPPKGSIIVLLGGMGAASCDQKTCQIISSRNDDLTDEDLLSVSFEGSLLRVHAEIFGPDGKIEAAIEKNQLIRNKSNTLLWNRPDTHSLEITDDRYKKSFSIRFINPHAVYIEGIFYSRQGHKLEVRKDKGIIRGFQFTGFCSNNLSPALSF